MSNPITPSLPVGEHVVLGFREFTDPTKGPAMDTILEGGMVITFYEHGPRMAHIRYDPTAIHVEGVVMFDEEEEDETD